MLWRKVVGSLLILGITGLLTLASDREVAAAGSLTVGGEIVYSTFVYSATSNPYKAYGVRTVGSIGSPLLIPLNSSGSAGISVDGKQVAVASGAAEDDSTLGLLQVSTTNGGQKRTIWKFLGEPLTAPAWNPEGTKIAITVQTQSLRGGQIPPGAVPGGLWVVPVKGGRPHRIAPAAYGSVAWSPNGKSLVYTTAYRNTGGVIIRTIPAEGGLYRKVVTIPANGPYRSVTSSVAWSPKGNSILIDSYQRVYNHSSLGRTEVLQVPSRGGSLKTLLPLAPNVSYEGATYSPDGKRIAVITQTAVSQGSTTTLIYPPVSVTLNTLSINGSDPQTIASLPSTSSANNSAQMIGWVNTLK